MSQKSNASDAPTALARDVGLCAQSRRLMAGLAEIYRLVDGDVAKIDAKCDADGACCKFDQFDHRLYVSMGELALLFQTPLPEGAEPGPLRCPYQVAGQCEARAGRPLGCRVFFCQTGLDQWCSRTYEAYHRQITRLHELANVPYAYFEMTAAMEELSTPGE